MRRPSSFSNGLLAALIVTVACGAITSCSGDQDRPAASKAPAFGPVAADGLPGALRGLDGFERRATVEDRRRLSAAADEALERAPDPADPLRVSKTDGPFVTDSRDAWTLALAGHLAGDDRYLDGASAIVVAWMSTATSTEDACPDDGGCSTSLMVSRAAPGLVFAVDLLVADGRMAESDVQRFHRWLREVILPTASDRKNNWGDAGTYLRVVVGAELGDVAILDDAAERWRDRIDLLEPDGRIPEEIRRGRASLMYSQEALDYKTATADVLLRHGIDVWSYRGVRGGTLRQALDLVARGVLRPTAWPVGAPDGPVRIPDPSGTWSIALQRWPDASFRELADEAAPTEPAGHSAVMWTHLTHPSNA